MHHIISCIDTTVNFAPSNRPYLVDGEETKHIFNQTSMTSGSRGDATQPYGRMANFSRISVLEYAPAAFAPSAFQEIEAGDSGVQPQT